MTLTAYASHPSTRRAGEFTTWFRTSTAFGPCLVGNSGWMETDRELKVGETVILPDNAVRFQPESFTGSKGEQITMNHIVAN
jgi:hypothetical protein